MEEVAFPCPLRSLNTNMKSTAIAVFALVALARTSAQAQVVSGQVVDSVSAMPVPRGFVVLLDRANAEVARGLADPDGRFTLRAPSPGTYRLRSERIGFHLAVSDPFTVSPEGITGYVLAISALPIRLADLAIRADGECQAIGEQQVATLVWEEARKALAAVAWGQRGQLLFDLRLRQRNLSPELEVVGETSRRVSGAATRPFTTPTPAELSTRGYVRKERDGSRLFDGPDAEILFSNTFLTEHCFRVATDTSARLVGLAFEPVRKRKLPEIAGTIWVDERSAELRFVSYRYVSTGMVGVDGEATGRVEFESLQDGLWIARQWYIRLPVVQMMNRPVSGARSMRLVPTPVIKSYVENGGEVLGVSPTRP